MAAPKKQALDDVKGFRVVELGFSKESKAKHQLLWKQHVVKTYDLDKPAERTLFVVNVPPYVTERNRKKKKQQKLVNFYSFQDRQTKMDHLAQLRKKFEEDKKRITQMRTSRKFKPY
ncbi:putative ribosomal RNA-processing protein 7-like A [Penaeus vannamei]|uniref:Putative ribosomal RNA-processing protein 7-like A n=1 Tax=Penaeus vannamei TaxID=6689 RepID=A0A3R7M3G6_PENVA|nr:putative ribosomal RNA-processing protein 7-like A [Penaeus vannamei]